MYRGDSTTTTTSEEEKNDCFGTNGSFEIPSIASHWEFASLHQSTINEDYGFNMYGDTMDGSFSPPSAINKTERKNLETYLSYPSDHFAACHPTSTSNYNKFIQVEGQNGGGRSLRKTVLGSTKTDNMNVRELLKAYGIVQPSGSKDGHTKVVTSRGLRDRRIRLSFETAINFFLVQDRLGFDQPSKALEWLLENSRAAIDELPAISPSWSADYFSSSMGADPYKAQWEIKNLGFPAQPSTLQEQPINNVWETDRVDERARICSSLNLSFNYG